MKCRIVGCKNEYYIRYMGMEVCEDHWNQHCEENGRLHKKKFKLQKRIDEY
jgi:hypothetical protein